MNVEEVKTSDLDAKDLMIDGKLKLHLKRNADGYSIDLMDGNGWLIEEMCVYDEDLDTEEIP